MIPLSRFTLPILADKLRKLFQPALDPARVQRVFHEFDVTRGYDAYAAWCREQYDRELPDADASPLLQQGFQTLDVLDPRVAAELVARASAENSLALLKRDSGKLKGYHLEDQAWIDLLFSHALTPAVDALCRRYFRSEYLVHWFALSVTAPSREPASVSFRWHCDKGPTSHLKLLVYLNGVEAHGGGTAFVGLDDTQAVARTGYLFARGRKRTGSLAELSAMAGRELHAYEHLPHAGDAVLFQPSRVMHSGITPSTGDRVVLTLCLLPSPMPWRQALARGTRVDLSRDPLWHGHARELQAQLENGPRT